MKRKYSALALIAALALTFSSPRPALGGFIQEAVKSGGASVAGLVAAEAFSQVAGAIYNNTCRPGAPEHNAVQFLCDTLASVSGTADEDWQRGVTEDLAAMKEDLAFLIQGQAAIQAQIDQVAAQNSVLLSRVDELADETLIRKDIALIRSMWEDEFSRLFERRVTSPAERTRYAQDLLAFADRVQAKDLAGVQGRLNDVLVRGGVRSSGNLLQRYAQTLDAQMTAAKTNNLAPVYDWFEGVFSETLFIQRQGYIMYLWSAEILESNCELDPACTRVSGMPHTSIDYRTVFQGHVEAQLHAFNQALEWLVLARSDPHSIRPDFLPAGAEAVFGRADLYTGFNLNTPKSKAGVRGRVISMGDTFDGKLRIGSRSVQPIATATVASAHGAVDWWRWTGNKDYTKLHREVFFANQWKVYRYHVELGKPGKVPIREEFPYAPDVEVHLLDMRTGQRSARSSRFTQPFGSFTAIERGGGGFAMMDGQWGKATWQTQDVIRGIAVRKDRLMKSFASQPARGYVGPKAGVESRVRLESQARPGREAAQDRAEAWVDGMAFFGYPDGGRLTLNVEFQPDFVACAYCDHQGFAEKDSLVAIWSDYRMGGWGPQPAALLARVRFVLNDYDQWVKGKQSTNGVVVALDLSNVTSPVHEKKGDRRHSAPVTLTRGKRYAPNLRVELTANQSTVGLDASQWKILADAHVANAYLTKD